MFPKMINPEIEKIIGKYSGIADAWKLTGAGGGGYLLMVSEKEIPNTIRIKVRVKELGL
jgi:galactokinase/mevalonate kinase-like predicted kinase